MHMLRSAQDHNMSKNKKQLWLTLTQHNTVTAELSYLPLAIPTDS
jgi:hypothetical protein